MILCRDVCKEMRAKSDSLAKAKDTKFKVIRHTAQNDNDGFVNQPLPNYKEPLP